MPDDFDPDAFLAEPAAPAHAGFDPDAFLAEPSAKAAPAATVKSLLPPIDTTLGRSIGQPAEVPAWGTMSQGSVDDTARPPSDGDLEDRHVQATKDTPLIPGMEHLSPQGIRAGLNGFTLGAAPWALAAADSALGGKSYGKELSKTHKLYSEATEENPGMALAGGLATPLPFGKMGLAAKLATGTAAGSLAAGLMTSPEADWSERGTNMAIGGAAGLALTGGAEAAGALGKALKGAIPKRGIEPSPGAWAKAGAKARAQPRSVSVAPEFMENLSQSLDQVPPPGSKRLAGGTQQKLLPGMSPEGREQVYQGMLKGRTNPEALQQLATDPASMPSVRRTNMSEMWPVDATVRQNTDGSFTGLVREIRGGEVGVYEHPINTVTEASQFRNLQLKNHPEVPFSLSPEVWGNMPDDVQRAIATEGRGQLAGPVYGGTDPYEILAGEVTNPDPTNAGSPGRAAKRDLMNTLPSTPPPGAEAPPSRPVPSEAIITADDNAVHASAAPVQIETVSGRTPQPPSQFALPSTPEQKLLGAGAPPIEPPPPPGPEPMPPPPPPGPPPAAEAAHLKMVDRIAKEPNLYDKMRRQLIGEHMRAPGDFASYVSDHQSIKNIEKMQYELYDALERGKGVKGARDFREDVLRNFAGHLSDAQMAERHPEAWVQKREMLGQAAARRDDNHQWLAERGYLGKEYQDEAALTAPSDEDYKKYVTREYAAHILPPKQWAKIIAKDDLAWKTAIEGFKNWNLKQGKEITNANAEALIQQALGSEDSAASLFGPSKSSLGAAGGKLKERQDLPGWYRNLLGENRDGFYAVARTIAAQEALIANFKVWEGVASNPNWASAEPKPGWIQLPDNKRAFGKASGMWTTPFIHDALVTIPNIKYESSKLVSAIMNIKKTNQVALPALRTFVNMFMDNVGGGMMSGGVDPTRPIATGMAMKWAAKAMKDFSTNPLSDAAEVAFLRDARRIGVDAPGHIGPNVSAIQKRQMQDALTRIGETKSSSYADILGAVAGVYAKAGQHGSTIVDGIDRIHKLASWKMLTDEFQRDGMPKEKAMREAAQRIFLSYIMNDRLAPAANKLRSGWMGVVANPYASFAMDRMRILGQLPKRLIDSTIPTPDHPNGKDPELPFRLLKYAIIGNALFGAGAGAFRNWRGEVSDEDVSASMKDREGTAQEKFNPAPWVLPAQVGGKTVVMNTTPWFGPLAYLQGDPSLSPVARIAINVLRAPLEGGAAGDGMDSLLNAGGIQMGMDPARMPAPGTGMMGNVAQKLADNGAIPNVVNDAYGNAKKAGLVGAQGPRKEVMPAGAAIARTLGAPIEQTMTVGQQGFSPASYNKLKTEKGAIGDATRLLHAAAKMPPDKAEPLLQAIIQTFTGSEEPQRQKLMKAAIDMKLKHIQELGAAGKAERAAKESHKKEQGK